MKGSAESLLTGMIYIDLQKAFDTIIHEIQFQKLTAIRFLEQSIQWFRPYLCDQIVLVGTEIKLCDFRKISCGVPRDFILGPLLVLIYVNDMHQAIKQNLLLYADDSCLVYQHKGIGKIENT